MGIKYYGPSDHPAGFIGFRVSLGFGGKHLESYNSTSVAKFQDERDPYFKLQTSNFKAYGLRFSYLNGKWKVSFTNTSAS